MVIVICYIVLILYHCTFTIWGFSKVSISGIGTLSVADIASLVLLFYALRLANRWKALDSIDGLCFLIVCWLFISALYNVISGELPLQLMLRSTCRIIPIWLSLPLLRRVADIDFRRLLLISAVIGMAVALTHSYIVLNDHRDMMGSMYYQYDLEGDSEVAHMTEWQLTTFDYVRVIPDGSALMLALAFATFLAALYERSLLKKISVALLCSIVYLAITLSLTRARMLMLYAVGPLFCLYRCRSNKSAIPNFSLMALILVVVSICLMRIRSDVFDNMLNRWASFSEDASLKTVGSPRVLDTRQGFYELMQRPVFGNGNYKLRDELSQWGGDVHGIISIGLSGGLPLIFFILTVIAYSVRQAWPHYDYITNVGLLFVCITMILILMNTDNAFDSPRGLLIMIIALACICRYRIRSDLPLKN